MAESSRLSDQWVGICCCHEDEDPPCPSMGGWIIESCPKTDSVGLGQARITGMTIGYCGHVGMVVSGASTAMCGSIGMARIGETVTGCNIGIVITGAPNHIVGS